MFWKWFLITSLFLRFMNVVESFWIQNWRSQYVILMTHFIVPCFVIFMFLFLFVVCLMSAWQPRTTTYGQACTSTIPCPGSNAGSSVCSRCPGGSTQAAGYVCPDGDHRRWSGRGFRCGTHPWPCHDRSLWWRTLRACQAWRHLPGKIRNSQTTRTSLGQISLSGPWTYRAVKVPLN